MIEYINSHMPGFWITLGFALLAAEVLLFGLTTIILIFAGLGALATGLLMMTGLLAQTWLAGIASFGLATGVVSVLLWKPLKSMQDQGSVKRKPSSDLVGFEFVLEQDISKTEPGRYRYSGVDWKVRIATASDADQISQGERVTVVSVEVGEFNVLRAPRG